MTLGLFDVAFLGALSGGSAYDPDAQDYINRVIAADVAAGNSSGLEVGVQDAYNAFFVDCKSDGMLNAIKASCILAGARTLDGALVPLVGTAPTNVNFVAGDYNRETGLAGDGSTKYLDSNRNNNDDPQNSKHIAVYATIKSFRGGTNAGYIGAGASGTSIFASGSSQTLVFAGINGGTTFDPINVVPGFIGANRSASNNLQCRGGGSTLSNTTASAVPANASIDVFRRPDYSNARLAFYSIGESLDLALLDARVTALMNALAAAIP